MRFTKIPRAGEVVSEVMMSVVPVMMKQMRFAKIPCDGEADFSSFDSFYANMPRAGEARADRPHERARLSTSVLPRRGAKGSRGADTRNIRRFQHAQGG